MQFRAALTVALLAVGALAAPVEKAHKRAGLLAQRAYADFQVSDGVAGNALAEVNAKFPVCRGLGSMFCSTWGKVANICATRSTKKTWPTWTRAT